MVIFVFPFVVKEHTMWETRYSNQQLAIQLSIQNKLFYNILVIFIGWKSIYNLQIKAYESERLLLISLHGS